VPRKNFCLTKIFNCISATRATKVAACTAGAAYAAEAGCGVPFVFLFLTGKLFCDIFPPYLIIIRQIIKWQMI